MSSPTSEAEKLKLQGNEALKQGKIEEALELYSEAIKCDSKNAALFSNRSAAYCKAGKYKEALTDAEAVIELKPTWSKGFSRKGSALQFLERCEEASIAYEEAIKLDPNNEGLKKSLKECKDKLTGPGGSQPLNPFGSPMMMQTLENHSSTREFMKDPSFRLKMQTLQSDPKALGQHLNDQRVVTALGVLMGMDFDVVRQGANDGDAATKDAEMPEAESEKAPAEEAMETDDGIEKTPVDDQQKAKAEKELGNAAYKKKDFDTALQHYGKAIELDPRDITYKNNRAAVYFEQGEYDKAIAECHEAVDIGRENRADFQLIAKALARIGNAYRKKDDLDESLKYLNKSVSEHRNPTVAKTIQEVNKMKAERERLAKIDPERSLKEKEKGNEFFKKGDYPSALKHYSEAVLCNPEDPKIYSNRAACYTKLARFDLALKDCETCLKIDPKFIKGYLRKGNIHMAMKENDKASDAFQKALDIDSNCSEAVEGYRRAMTEDSKDPEVIRKRAMANPEVQKILSDPAMQMILQQMQRDPKALQEHLKNPDIAKNIEKLLECGLISIR